MTCTVCCELAQFSYDTVLSTLDTVNILKETIVLSIFYRTDSGLCLIEKQMFAGLRVENEHFSVLHILR